MVWAIDCHLRTTIDSYFMYCRNAYKNVGCVSKEVNLQSRYKAVPRWTNTPIMSLHNMGQWVQFK